jgi:hypothetical protein
MEYKKGIPWSLVALTVPSEKDQNPIKLLRWFISVPDGEIFYVLVIHGNVKGKFLYRYQEKKVCSVCPLLVFNWFIHWF